MTQPPEESIRAAFAEAGILYDYAVSPMCEKSARKAILALARRIEAEWEAVQKVENTLRNLEKRLTVQPDEDAKQLRINCDKALGHVAVLRAALGVK